MAEAATRGVSAKAMGMRALLLLAVLPVVAWAWMEGWRLAQADWAATPARQQVEDWAARTRRLPEAARVDAAEAALKRAVGMPPHDPTLHERLGDLQLLRARERWNDTPVLRAMAAEAARHFEAAVALRPAEPGAWAGLAQARWLAGEPRDAVYAAWERARALGPHEGHVQPVLMEIALADWDQAPEAVQDWATHLFDQSPEAVRRQINALAREYGLNFEPDTPKAGQP
jgi:tetratricopeptide (TPR) repeat protein